MMFAAALTTMFDHEFMRNAFLTVTVLAPACGLVGYVTVIRNEVFAADALSHVAFTGSLAALAYGVNQRLGLFAATLVVGAILGTFGRRTRIGDATIGVIFTCILGFGVLFLSMFTAHHSTTNGRAGPTVLFGSVFGITHERAQQTAVISVLVILAIVTIARPLLFASFDAAVAAARGVPTRFLAIAFAIIMALAVAEATQVVGALLLLGLIATPAAAAHRLTARPFAGMWIAAGLCVTDVWIGLSASYVFPRLPPSFSVIAISFGFYVIVVVGQGLTKRRRIPEPV